MGFDVDDSRIQAAEVELGRELPAPLRERLRRDNGGEVEARCALGEDGWWLHPVWDDGDRKRAGRSANHVIRETEAARRWSGFPADAIAIADNGSGDRLVLLPGSERIHWWDHETGETHEAVVTWNPS